MSDKTKPKLVLRHKGYEVWAIYVEEAEIYEICADPDGETYIGNCDTLEQARAFGRDWIEEKLSF